MSRTVHVALGERAYDVEIGSGQLANPKLTAQVAGRHVLIVSDGHVAPLYLARVRAALAGKTVASCILPPGEQEKTLGRFAEVMQSLADMGASRDVTVVALGGGVVGDLAGFAAACWMRGVRFVQLPTTLLAMVDSSIGGKTAVDLPGGKNLVGAFHQPVAVLADTDTLATLPDRELRAGFAEVIKIGAIGDAGFFAWLEDKVDALLGRDAGALEHAIATSCAHKSRVVERDETEQGERMLLNFGHTFGHAIETAQGYGGLLHGEAVAIGMLAAARLSSRLGLGPEADALRLQSLLHRFGLPTEIPTGLGAEQLFGHMKLDKKAESGAIRLILWRGIGQAEVFRSIPDHAILSSLS